MTDALDAPPGFTPARFLIGALIALCGHGLTFAAAFIAARLVEPSPGGGFEDLAAVVVTFLLGQVVLAVGCLVGSIVLAVRRRQDLAAGLIMAWAIGMVAVVLFVRA